MRFKMFKAVIRYSFELSTNITLLYHKSGGRTKTVVHNFMVNSLTNFRICSPHENHNIIHGTKTHVHHDYEFGWIGELQYTQKL